MFLSKRSNGIYYLWYFDDSGKRHKVSTGCQLKSDALKFVQRFKADLTPVWRSVLYIGNGSKEGMMKGKKYTAEQIVSKLREAEVLLGKGMALGEVCRQLEITDVTYYRWRKEYGGLRVDQDRRLKELEPENGRLKKAVADLTLDNMILKEVNRKNF